MNLYFIRIILFSFLHLDNLLHLCEGRTSKLRKFIPRGTLGSKLNFQIGDTVVSFIIPNKYFVSRPYLYYFALSDYELLSFKPSKSKLYRKVRPKIVGSKSKLATTKLLNRKKRKADYIGPVGQLVGRMMVGIPLYYDMFFCNDKHYVHYLTYGAYSDKWYEDHMFRVSKKCPVRAPLTRDMLKTILKTKTFTLMDAYEKQTTLTVNNWEDSRWSHPRKVRFSPTPEVREFTPDPREYKKPPHGYSNRHPKARPPTPAPVNPDGTPMVKTPSPPTILNRNPQMQSPPKSASNSDGTLVGNSPSSPNHPNRNPQVQLPPKSASNPNGTLVGNSPSPPNHPNKNPQAQVPTKLPPNAGGTPVGKPASPSNYTNRNLQVKTSPPTNSNGSPAGKPPLSPNKDAQLQTPASALAPANSEEHVAPPQT